MKLLKLVVQVLVHALLMKVANSPSLLDSPRKDLSSETLMKINRLIDGEL